MNFADKNVDEQAQNICELSVVTPVFNRAQTVLESIRSSVRMLQESGAPGEIVVVDDASTDGSADVIEAAMSVEIKAGKLRFLRLSYNQGVTAAKQIGAKHARGDWLIFMDSDDEFATGSGMHLLEALRVTPKDCPVVFFRCVDSDTGRLIGPANDTVIDIDLGRYLRDGTPGECLPVVRRTCLLKIPYAADLRGFEQLTYAKLIEKHGRARIHPYQARIYNTEDTGDRLSARASVRRRGCLLVRGYLRMLGAFGFRLKGRLPSIIVRIAYHAFNCIKFRVTSYL